MITFGAREAEQAKNDGIAQAAAARSRILARARSVARELSLARGETNADAVKAELELQGEDSTGLGNAAGAIFRGKNWKFVRYIKSVQVSRHANKIGVWQYRPTTLERASE